MWGEKKTIFKKVFLSSLTFQIKVELFLLRIKCFFFSGIQHVCPEWANSNVSCVQSCAWRGSRVLLSQDAAPGCVNTSWVHCMQSQAATWHLCRNPACYVPAVSCCPFLAVAWEGMVVPCLTFVLRPDAMRPRKKPSILPLRTSSGKWILRLKIKTCHVTGAGSGTVKNV